ncbi:hypothetical protein MMC26_003023 [Xylographa opegraphella]|nr:hypothetical protein [Xylographa opegraphella]
MADSDFDEYLSGEIDAVEIDFGMPEDIELSPPSPTTIPGTDRLAWVKKYKADFQKLKASNAQMKAGIAFYQRILARSMHKIAVEHHRLATVEKEYETANQRLAQSYEILGNAIEGPASLCNSAAGRNAATIRGQKVVADLTTPTFDEAGLWQGT